MKTACLPANYYRTGLQQELLFNAETAAEDFTWIGLRRSR